MWKSTLMVPNIIAFIYRLEGKIRIFDIMLYEVDSGDIPRTIAVRFITLIVNWCNNRFLSLIRQFFPLPNGIS
jgi:hypothetical protein